MNLSIFRWFGSTNCRSQLESTTQSRELVPQSATYLQARIIDKIEQGQGRKLTRTATLKVQKARNTPKLWIQMVQTKSHIQT